MKKNRLLGFALIGVGVGVGIYLAKKHKEKRKQENYRNDEDDCFNDEEFFCDVESVDKIRNRYVQIKIEKKEDIFEEKEKNNIEEDVLVELTNSECSDEELVEENKNLFNNKIDYLTKELDEETRNEILRKKEIIIAQREELFKNKREGLIVGKEFKEKKKILGQQEEELNRILANMKK